MPELGKSGSAGGPGWATTQVYPTHGPAARPRMTAGFVMRWTWWRPQAAFLNAGKRGARPDRAPFGRPGERPQGFGAFAGVSSVTKSCGNA
jgi:hypothetical protein